MQMVVLEVFKMLTTAAFKLEILKKSLIVKEKSNIGVTVIA